MRIISEKKDWLNALLISGVYFIILFCLFSFQLSEDDTYFKTYVSGFYTGVPEAYLGYIKYLYASILCICYNILPTINWYSIFSYTIFIFAVFFIIKKLFQINKNRWLLFTEITTFLTIFTSAFLHGLIELNFSYVASVAGITAIFYAFLMPQKTKNDMFVVISMLAISYWVRDEVFLIAFCFCALIITYRFLIGQENDVKNKKTILACALCLVLIVIGTSIVEKKAYSVKEWVELNKYTADKTVVYDYYGFPEYQANKDMFDKYDMTQNEYELLTRGCYLVEERSTINHIYEDMAKCVQAEAKVSGVKQIAVKLYDTAIRFYDCWFDGAYSFFNLAIMLMYTGMILYFEIIHKRKEMIFISAGLAGYALLWVYLIWRGRINAHATIPLQMAAFMFMFGMLVNTLPKLDQKFSFSGKSVIIWGLLFCNVYTMGYNVVKGINLSNSLYQEAKFADLVISYATQNEENFYFCNTNRYAHSRWNGIFEKENTSNMLYWANISPLSDKKMQMYGIKESILSLIGNDNVYFMLTEDEQDLAEMIEIYFTDKGYNVSVDCIDTIESNNHTMYVYDVNEE